MMKQAGTGGGSSEMFSQTFRFALRSQKPIISHLNVELFFIAQLTNCSDIWRN